MLSTAAAMFSLFSPSCTSMQSTGSTSESAMGISPSAGTARV